MPKLAPKFIVLLCIASIFLPVLTYENKVSAQSIAQINEAEQLLQQGFSYFVDGKFKEGLASFQKTLEVYRRRGDRLGEANSLSNLGDAYASLGQFSEAIKYYQQALELRRQNQNRLGEANMLNSLGSSFVSLSQYPKALELHQQALFISKQISDRSLTGDTLNYIGNVYYQLSEYTKAKEMYEQSLGIFKEVKDIGKIANALSNLGLIYKNLGEYPKAIELYQQALLIKKELGDRRSVASITNNLGSIYKSLGAYPKAIELYQQALLIKKELGDRSGEGNTISNLGSIYQNLGEYPKAIEVYQQALNISKEIGDRSLEETSLNNLGNIYAYLGQPQKSITLYQQSLSISQQIGDRKSTAISLNNLGNNYDTLNDFPKAIELYQQSLKIFQQIGDRQLQASSLSSLGNGYESLGEYRQAQKFYQQSLVISQQIGDRQGIADATTNLGIIQRRLGNYTQAVSTFQQSLTIFKQLGDRTGERKTLNNLGVTLTALNQTDLAILAYKQSLNITESIRQDINKLTKQDRNSYLDTVAGSYRRLADLLLQKGRVIEALEILDLLKIQELEDYFKNIRTDNRSALVPKTIRLLPPELNFSKQLLNPLTIKTNQELSTQIHQLAPTEINQVPSYLQKIPQDAVLIYPLVLGDRLEVILLSANKLPINAKVKISKAEFEELIKDFRSDLQNIYSQDVKISGKKVYDLMLKPLEPNLNQLKPKIILYAPDDILRYIPLSALYDGKQWLIEKYQVDNLIAYSLFQSKSASIPSSPRIFAGAFGGKDGEKRFGTKGLAASIPEIANIAKIFSNVTRLSDRNFTAAAAKNQVMGNNIIHFATHAEFNSGSPLDSYILFGDGSKVTLAEISSWQLKGVDLVVLSACETGIGTFGTAKTGTEVLGFGYQVQRAGARAAIASLWTVSDGGTQLLMDAFYQNLRNENSKQNILSAMRNSQLKMIKKAITKGEPNYNHPYFWSSFILIGAGI